MNSRRILTVALTAGAAIGAANAQDTRPPDTMQNAPQSQSEPRTPPDATQQPQSGEPRTSTNKGMSMLTSSTEFTRIAHSSGVKEVRTAQQAIGRVTNAEVRKVAERLVRDHAAVNQRLSALAERKGWNLTQQSASASNSAADSVNEPMKSDGDSRTPKRTTDAAASFDAEFINAQIRGHEKSVALYRQQAHSGDDADVRSLARETLPKLEAHLAELRRLQR